MKPGAAARAPSTPESAMRRASAPSPGRSRSHAHALFESYDDFAAAGRKASVAVEASDALCDVVWRACADAVARRVPTPRQLAVEWVPRFVADFGGRFERGALRRAAACALCRNPSTIAS